MKTHKYLPLLFFFALCFPSLSQAQTLYRCKDAAGKTTYSDTPCLNASVQTLNANPNLNTFDSTPLREEVERQQAIEESRQRQREIDTLRAQIGTGTGSPADQVSPQGTSYACNQARKELEFASTAVRPDREGFAPKERAVREACGVASSGVAPPPLTKKEKKELEKQQRREERKNAPYPRFLTSCSEGGCWDSLGVHYTGQRPSLFNTLTGEVCHVSGSQIHCP